MEETLEEKESKLKVRQEVMTRHLTGIQTRTNKTYKLLCKLIKTKMSENTRIKISNLVLNRIQMRDSVAMFVKSDFNHVQDFLSQIQLKYTFLAVPPGFDSTK